MNVAVLGAGGWGTTLSIVLHENGHDVDLWEFNSEYAKTIAEYRENFYYLPGIKIPRKIRISNDLESSIFRKNLIIVATPTQFIRNSFESLKNYNFGNSLIVSVSKGIEKGSLMLVSDMLLDVLKKTKSGNILCLSGPSHAEEVSRRVPTAVVCAGTDNEIMKLGLKMNARRETFFGLSGIGDLIVTCSSKHSRNRSVGEQIGKGRKLDEILKEMKMVAEGVTTTESAFELSKKLNIELPITSQVYKILFAGKDPQKATKVLMTRELKIEN
ncbi:MAG: NAD(P)-dependent glycerol-3-phosphate dehydrogenase [Ignavibacteria bacterium]|nr:NAD(P)-dependent glycerol-3-phosphate dehydrogenase [Ignavibacteria bacterium]